MDQLVNKTNKGKGQLKNSPKRMWNFSSSSAHISPGSTERRGHLLSIWGKQERLHGTSGWLLLSCTNSPSIDATIARSGKEGSRTTEERIVKRGSKVTCKEPMCSSLWHLHLWMGSFFLVRSTYRWNEVKARPWKGKVTNVSRRKEVTKQQAGKVQGCCISWAVGRSMKRGSRDGRQDL